MSIDWASFTPWTALAGGALIGLAAAIFALANGRVAGTAVCSAAFCSQAQKGAARRHFSYSACCWRRCCGGCSAPCQRSASMAARCR